MLNNSNESGTDGDSIYTFVAGFILIFKYVQLLDNFE